MDDLRLALAFASRRSGKRAMAPSAWAHTLSLELGWMTPGEAKRFIAAASAAGLLEGADEAALTFDASKVEVPRGFRPDPDAAPAPAAATSTDPFEAALKSWAQTRGQPLPEVLAEVASAQEAAGGLLDAETALLWVRAKQGDDVQADAAAALNRRLARESARSDTP